MKKPQYRCFALCLFVFFSFATALFCNSCAILGVMGTPTGQERVVTAEYDLARHKDQKILILVEQPGWLSAGTNLRFYLTDAITRELTRKLKLTPECFVAYDELSQFRSDRSDFSLLSPVEVGKALNADVALLVSVEDCQLNEMAEANYYSGLLAAQAALFETASGRRLWPESGESKSIKVGFDIESLGPDVAVRRLAAGCAYCTVRYFYNCPKNKFKIADDRSSVGWEDWEK